MCDRLQLILTEGSRSIPAEPSQVYFQIDFNFISFEMESADVQCPSSVEDMRGNPPAVERTDLELTDLELEVC